MREIIEKHIDKVKNIIETKEIDNFTFNLTELPPHNNFELDIRKHGRFEELFKKLDQKITYCLYWFECESETKAENLVAILNQKRDNLVSDTGKLWRVPPFNQNLKSKVIYVGVRQGGVRKRDNLSNLSGRMVQHLGYYPKESTGALHFLQWASNQDFDITLNILEIGEPEEKQYLYIIEKFASIALKPLCGEH